MTRDSVFVVPKSDLPLLLRAISTMQVLGEMYLKITLRVAAAGNSTLETEKLSPFFSVRGLGGVILKGVYQEKNITKLQRIINPWTYLYVNRRMESFRDSGAKAHSKADWPGAASAFEALLTFHCDLQKISPEHCHIRSAGTASRNLAGSAATYLAEVRFMLGDFHSTMKYTT